MDTTWVGERFCKEAEKGQDLAEYGLLIGFIALVVVLAVTVLGMGVSSLFSKIVEQLPF